MCSKFFACSLFLSIELWNCFFKLLLNSPEPTLPIKDFAWNALLAKLFENEPIVSIKDPALNVAYIAPPTIKIVFKLPIISANVCEKNFNTPFADKDCTNPSHAAVTLLVAASSPLL